MATDEILNRTYQEINRRRGIRLVILRVAAAILIIAATCITLYKYSFNDQTTTRVQSWTTYTTHANEVRTLRLPDQSLIVLSPGTTLMLPATFSTSGKGEVKLETGEAYFTIPHGVNRPYYVYSGQIFIKVLGSTFNIKNNTGSDLIEVAVAHGKLEVHTKLHRLAQLSKGKLIWFDMQAGSFKLGSINDIDMRAWNKNPVNLYEVDFN